MTGANTPDLRALVKRLEAKTHESDGLHGVYEVLRNPDGPAAAAALSTLQHRVAEMEAALEDAEKTLCTLADLAEDIRLEGAPLIRASAEKARSALKDRGEGL
jgi:energy-converting hydrogenase A subunit M